MGVLRRHTSILAALPLRPPGDICLGCAAGPLPAGPEGEQVASQLLPLPDSTRSLQQMMASVNATCSTTLGDAGAVLAAWVLFVALAAGHCRQQAPADRAVHAIPHFFQSLPVAVSFAEVVFMARLPPLGYSTFYLQPGTGIRGDSGGSSCVSASEPQQRGTVGSSNKGHRFVTLDNGLVSLEFDTQTGVRVWRAILLPLRRQMCSNGHASASPQICTHCAPFFLPQAC